MWERCSASRLAPVGALVDVAGVGVTGVNLERLDSLVEDRDMLAENLENLVKKERLEGREEGREEGRLEANQASALNLIKLGVLTDEQIAEAPGLTTAEVQALRAEDKH
ncbi:hypothetical protein [Halomonas alkalisoli]|uniref:hypothetical protein n=1 Tax=Halomonas alkalisoli TaxID=2907158 RepID=UPI001F37C7AE|nr:hypothetical protein [Halomonas alkalisoli]MCE9682351.1 hypothetical protein [Halomonas alkalisoli]